MAYLGNVDLRYELFRAGVEALSEFDSELSWWPEVTKSKARFDRAMSKLQDYSLVEVGTGSYSMHTCVHDWTLERLNFEDDGRLCRLAVQCVARSVKSKTESEFWMVNRRLLSHVSRFEHVRVKDRIDWTKVDMVDLFHMAQLYSDLDMKGKAEQMCVRSLQGYEKARGPDHTSTLDAVHRLGNLYADQGKMVEAEQMYIRALQGRESTMGLDHTSTLDMVNNLGLLYADQGKMAEAEQMYIRALQGYEEAWGPEHMSKLDTVHNLGLLYADQGKMVEAEKMYLRALQGYETAWGPEHTSTLDTVHNLGLLYAGQGKVVEAEKMCLRALQRYEKAKGPNHASTLDMVNNLGNLYKSQEKMIEAEKMYMRALQGYEETWGSHHKSTLNTVYNLGDLYSRQGKLKEAENVYGRALKECIKEFGLDHPSTIKIATTLCRNLSESISKQVLQSGKMIRDQPQIISQLVGLANTWGSKSLAIFGALGRALLWNSDELNAQIAFQQQVDFQHGVLVYPRILCDGCNLPLTCSMKRFVCKRCYDVDLCGQCFRRRETDIKVVPTCSDHSFLKISLGMLAGSNTDHLFGKTPRELWMQSLMRKYLVAAAGPDHNEPSRE
jgi:tetratricopeptide (TPR) repeat protein